MDIFLFSPLYIEDTSSTSSLPPYLLAYTLSYLYWLLSSSLSILSPLFYSSSAHALVHLHDTPFPTHSSSPSFAIWPSPKVAEKGVSLFLVVLPLLLKGLQGPCGVAEVLLYLGQGKLVFSSEILGVIAFGLKGFEHVVESYPLLWTHLSKPLS